MVEEAVEQGEEICGGVDAVRGFTYLSNGMSAGSGCETGMTG